ncbi:MAG: hypothetical protein DRR04_12275 [Gammaproteobacteria bacterium]|nr:MAG: hypothetical protein DRR04_12275 [Gammaproteobacteria bacterium]
MSKRVLLGVVLTGLIAGLALVPAASARAAQDESAEGRIERSPGIEFETKDFEFGDIFDDEPQTVKFKFSNVGDGTLVIRELQASCQCTAGELGKRSYEPGESGEITVVFNPKGKRGNQRQYVRVFSNDPDKKQVMINVRGRVRPRIYIDPKLLGFGGMRHGQTKTMSFTVSGRGEDFKVTEATIRNSDAFSTKIVGPRPMTIDNEDLLQYEIHVTLDGTLPLGMHSDSVVFKTTDPFAEERSINLSARLNGQLLATPQTVKIGRARVDTPYNGSFVVSNRDGFPFKITGVSVESAQSQAPEVNVVAIDDTSYKVTFRGTPVKGDRFAQGTVIVLTDVKGEPEVRVKYHAVVLRK